MNNTHHKNNRTVISPVRGVLTITNIHPQRRSKDRNRSRTGGFVAWPEAKSEVLMTENEEGKAA